MPFASSHRLTPAPIMEQRQRVIWGRTISSTDRNKYTVPKQRRQCCSSSSRCSMLARIKNPLGRMIPEKLSAGDDEHSQFNLDIHLRRGKWVDASSFEFGDVVNMCVTGEQRSNLRYYQYWKSVTVDGKPCLLFLSQITNGLKGPIDGTTEFFQSVTSFILKDPFKDHVFVDAVHTVVMVPPSHGKLFVQIHQDRKGTPEDLGRLKGMLDHWVKGHPELYQRLCKHAGMVLRGGCSADGLIESTRGIAGFLRQDKEKCSKLGCRHCHDIMDKAVVSLGRSEGRRFGERAWSSKVQPSVELCEFLTGRGLHFDPAIHK